MAQAVYTLSEDEAYQLSGALIISLTDVRLQHAIADLRELFEVTWPLVQKVGAVDDPEVGWYKVERMIRVHGKVLLKTENK